jgi:hypothetical protein
MKARPILFNADMVRAILNGHKTMTRRPVKPLDDNHPTVDLSEFDDRLSGRLNDPDSWGYAYAEDGNHMSLSYWLNLCPHGKPGDLLWVRETFVTGYPVDDGMVQSHDEDGNDLPEVIYYRADRNIDGWLNDDTGWCDKPVPWKPSIHMPRWASRLTLRITNIRVERVQDISEADCENELGKPPNALGGMAYTDFGILWNSIYSNWHENPWVWVPEFEVIHANVDEVLKEKAA